MRLAPFIVMDHGTKSTLLQTYIYFLRAPGSAWSAIKSLGGTGVANLWWVTIRFGGTSESMDTVHGNSQGCKTLKLLGPGCTMAKVCISVGQLMSVEFQKS
jgi:hypothetical protein